MLKVLKTSKDFPNEPLNYKDFQGKVEIALVQGKGRGLFAKEEFQPGDLILANRALVMIYPNFLPPIPPASSLKNKLIRFRLLKEAVANLVRKSCSEGEKVYSLDAGPNLGYLETSNIQKLYSENGNSDSIVDSVRIEGICTVNGFEGQKATGLRDGPFGIWYTPSFINHDCFNTNANWTIYSDFMFIRASKFIQKGEEILMSYIDPNQPYFVRREMFIKHDFICSCKLCSIERKEGKSKRTQREILLSDFKDDVINEKDDSDNIESYVESLQELRPDHPNELNPFLLSPLMHLGLVHFEGRNYKEAITAFQRAYKICQVLTQLSPADICLAEGIVKCYLKLDLADEAIKWIKELKNCLVISYGRDDKLLDILKWLKPKFVIEMENYDICLTEIF